LLLVVEDDFLIRSDVEASLREEGFDLLLAVNGAEAISYLDEDVGRFQALVTDIDLGKGPNGWEVAHRARELSPGLPVIYATGGSQHGWAANGVPESILLAKPVLAAQLLAAIAEKLTEAEMRRAMAKPDQGGT
jgi:DNA-binding NtrC family response regulator